MKTVVFDCDDVLVNLREPMACALNQLTGMSHRWQDWTRYDLFGYYDISPRRFVELMTEHSILDGATLDPGAPAVFEALYSRGFAVEVWTARAWYPGALEITLAQLEHLNLSPEQVVLFGLDESKAARAVSRPDVVGFVDDAPHHINALHAGGFQGRAVVMDRPWNQECAGHRAYSLPGVAEYFCAEEKAVA